MAGRVKGDAQPGQTWNRHFNHPYTARKSPPKLTVPVVGCPAPVWAVFNSSFGPVQGLRGYNTPAQGVPALWPGPGTGVMPAQVPPPGQIVSIKPDIGQVLAGTLDTALAAYFALVPAGAFVSCWHEGELTAAALGYTQAQVIAMHTRVYGIFGASAPAASSYGQIVAASAAFSGNAGFPLGPWTCSPANGGALLDFYGIDIGPFTQTITFADTIGAVMTAMITAGVPQSGPWTIAEVATNSAWRGQQSQWLSDGWNVAQKISAIHYMPFFQNDLTDVLEHWPPASTDTLRVLQDIAAISRGDPRSPAAVTPARSTTAAMVSSASSAGLSAPFTSNPAAGSKVLVAIQAGLAAGLTVTDNGTTPATFRQDAACFNVSGMPSVFVFRADNITLPASGVYTVSVARSPTGSLQVAAAAYTGVQNGPPSATSAIIGTGNLPALDAIIPADLASLFFSAFFSDSSQNPESITPASPEFLLGVTQVNGTSLTTGALSDALAASPAPRAGGWTLSDAPDFSAVMAAYGAFPANIDIVPGADSVWAQAPDPVPGISANAGLAAASAAAAPVYPGHNAGLAAASAWAAVNAPATGNATAGLAPASGAAAAATASVTVTAGLAAATGAAPFSASGGTVSDTLTAANPVGAAGAALNATGSPAGTPAVAAATGIAATATGNVSATPAAATAAGAALNATVTTTGVTNAPAGLAAATGAAGVPAVTVAPPAAIAAATGAAPAVVAGDADAAGLASASAAARQVIVTVTVTAGLAAATGAANAPTVVTGVAPAAGLAAGTAAAQQPGAVVAVTAGLASASGAALAPTVVTGVAPAAGLALAAGTGQPAAVTVTVTAGLAAATGTGQAASGIPTRPAPAGLASASAAALAPSLTLTTLAHAAAAQALAAALNPAVTTAAAFTVGTLTASGASGSVLSATDQRAGGPS